MTTLTLTDTADVFSLEHRLPIGWVLAGALAALNITATILMLVAQG